MISLQQAVTAQALAVMRTRTDTRSHTLFMWATYEEEQTEADRPGDPKTGPTMCRCACPCVSACPAPRSVGTRLAGKWETGAAAGGQEHRSARLRSGCVRPVPRSPVVPRGSAVVVGDWLVASTDVGRPGPPRRLRGAGRARWGVGSTAAVAGLPWPSVRVRRTRLVLGFAGGCGSPVRVTVPSVAVGVGGGGGTWSPPASARRANPPTPTGLLGAQPKPNAAVGVGGPICAQAPSPAPVVVASDPRRAVRPEQRKRRSV